VSALERGVFAGGRSKPFGELTLEEVQERARELRDAASAGGPAARVMPVAMAWAELARTMAQSGASSVMELGAEAVEARAEKLWVSPPGGSLLA
jgi:acyl CoA:acetate/3-ketoacid CoA transferase beta subunit